MMCIVVAGLHCSADFAWEFCRIHASYATRRTNPLTGISTFLKYIPSPGRAISYPPRYCQLGDEKKCLVPGSIPRQSPFPVGSSFTFRPSRAPRCPPAPCKCIVPGDRQDHMPCFDPSEHIAQMTDPGSGRTPPPSEGAGRSRLLMSETVLPCIGTECKCDIGQFNIGLSLDSVQGDVARESVVFL
jgi:hypothetical protein